MTLPSEYRSRSGRIGAAVLWSSAALVTAFAHVASAAWLLRQEPVEISDSGPPPAIMIELAAEPEAVNTEMEQVSEDIEDSQEVANLAPVADQPPPEPDPEPQPEPEPVVQQEPEPEPEPVQEITETVPEPPPELPPMEEPEPIPQEVVKLEQEVEVPIPVPAPKPPEPEQVKEEPKPRPKPKKVEVKKEKPRPAPAAKATVAAASEVTQSTRNAASQSASGSSSSSVSPARWQARVQAHLARRKKQLTRVHKSERATVYVRFNIDTGGNVLSVALSRSSGFPTLDQEVLAMVRQASPVPAPPPDVGRTLTVPIEFTTR